MDPDPLKKAMVFAYRYLARSARSRFEIEHRLREKGYSDPIIRRVIRELEASRYIDDKTLAHQWARDRFARHGWGPSRLRFALERKGIATEWIEEALNELFANQEEEQRAVELVERRFKRRHLGDPREYRRCSGFLLRRGYSMEVIRSVLRKMRIHSDTATD